jgi:hypothetical protein
MRTHVKESLVFRVALSTTVLVGSLALAGCGGGAPILTDFNPKTARAGVSVTITGSNLGNATAVTFGGGQAAALAADTATQIVATVPARSASGNLSGRRRTARSPWVGSASRRPRRPSPASSRSRALPGRR